MMDKLVAFLKKMLLTLKRLAWGLEYKVYFNSVLLATVKTKKSEVEIRVDKGIVRSPGLKPGETWMPTVRIEPPFQPGGTNIIVRCPPWIIDDLDLSRFEKLSHARA